MFNSLAQCKLLMSKTGSVAENRQVQNLDRINSDRLIQVGLTRINPDWRGLTKT